MIALQAATLLLLNIVFTYLSYKLYMEFGWKIYKRVRFNIKLRGKMQTLWLKKLPVFIYFRSQKSHLWVSKDIRKIF